MANAYTRINPVMVIATEDITLERAIWDVTDLIENKEAVLSRVAETVKAQPDNKTVTKGDVGWLMFSWDKPSGSKTRAVKFAAMFFFDGEPLSWNWVTTNKKTFETFKTLDQMVTEL